MKPLIAVSGRNGQLGWELERLSATFPGYDFVFTDRNELDIADESQLKSFFGKYQPSVFINCAAYTAVDKAEQDQETAYRVNAQAMKILAIQCKQNDTFLISFSTDYVFNGNGSEPYEETNEPDPVNYYGFTKLAGEQLALQNWLKTVIIRTSWVYSFHGNNFVKTMLRLMKERPEINVVNDQLGSPTYAKDLAMAVMKIVDGAVTNKEDATFTGVYHFSNEGIISWFDFASAIREMAGLNCIIHPIPTTSFPTPAKRPHYSVLNTKKIQEHGIAIRNWKLALSECMNEFK